jgi:hypothetical protein
MSRTKITKLDMESPGETVGKAFVTDGSGDVIISGVPAENHGHTGYSISGHAHIEADVTDLEHDAIKIQTRDVSSNAPSTDDALRWSGTEWIPSGVSNPLEVQEDDAQKVTGTTVINFEGAVTVVDEGGNKATITISGVSGSGITGIDVEEAGSQKVSKATILNFASGATVTDAGGGQADIAVSGGGQGAADFTAWNPLAPPASGSAYDDEFDDSSLAGKWSELDVAGTLTVNEVEYGVYFTGGTVSDIQGIYQTLSADEDFAIYTQVSILNQSDGDHIAGLMFVESPADLANSDIYAYGLYRGGSVGVRGGHWSDYNSIVGNDIDRTGGPGTWNTTYWLRARQEGTTWNFGYSEDGITWFDFGGAEAPTRDFVPSGIGLFQRLSNVSDTNNKVIFRFFRHTTNATVVDILEGDRVNMWRA